MSGIAIPAALVPALRSALVSQGFPAATIGSDGTLNPAGLLAGAYREVEIRTSGSPTVVMNTAELLADGPSNPILAWLRPTIILRSAGGDTVIAPYGVSEHGSILPGLAVVAALVGAGYVLGRVL